VLSGSPEFFVARNTTLGRVIVLLFILCVLLPLAVAAVERILRAVSRRAATFFHCLMIAGLTAALVAPPLKHQWPDSAVAIAALAGVTGLGVAVGYWRLPVVRSFLTLLAPAALVAPGVFLFDGDIRGALVPSRAGIAATTFGRTPPIVLIVFDEFPATSLLDGNHQIDPVRYPNFAALARESYWFRNASAVSGDTLWSVPSIVSGRYPTTPNAVPTLRYYPDNLFTLLGSKYEMFVFGRFLQLCPESRCHHDLEVPPDTVVALVSDLAIVWLHIVLPEPWLDGVPTIVGDWKGFARARQWRASGDERRPNERSSEFDRFLSTIQGGAARLHFLHMLIPHMPFEYVPSGRRYRARDYQATIERGVRLFERASAEYADAVYQRHLLQVGFVDTLIGRLTDRLRAVGAYDSALVIVTADHGASYREGVPRRNPTYSNMSDIIMVPLFVKVPGQHSGEVVDRNVETVDILPAIADVLSVEMPFRVDGRSLLDADRAERTTKTFISRNNTRVRVDKVDGWRERQEIGLERKLRRFGSGAVSLYSTPGTRHIQGQPVARFQTGSWRRLRVAIQNPEGFSAVNLSDMLPIHVRGLVSEPAAPPLTLAVVVNGIVAATTVSYMEKDVHVFSTLVPEEYLRPGRNDVAVFVVDEERRQVVLGSWAGGR
jgi:hypothetical protein